MWSGPRNISTAMMRAFENRPDTRRRRRAALRRVPRPHRHRPPGARRGHRLAAHRPRRGGRRLCGAAPGRVPVHYAKHMAHHVSRDMDLGGRSRFHNVLLIRDPAEVVASYVRAVSLRAGGHRAAAAAGCSSCGTRTMSRCRSSTRATSCARPRPTCAGCATGSGIPFTDRMLSWPTGPRDSDGVWAPHWYAAVCLDRLRALAAPRDRPLDHDAAVAEACRPIYEALHARRVRV